MPTLKKAQELTGLSLLDNTLGSTGKTETSGDLDVVVDSNKTNKDEFIKHLISKGVDPSHLKKTGNININQPTPQGTPTPSANAERDRLAAWAFSS